MAPSSDSESAAAEVADENYGDPFEFPVELGKIREFAKSLRSDNPVWRLPAAAAEAGLSGVPMPPTFPIAVQHWDPVPAPARGDLKLDLKRILHGEQEFIFHGPPPVAGTVLTGRQRLAEIREKEGKRGGTMTFVVTETDFADETGRVVVTAKSTLIQTGKVVEREG